MARLSKTFSKVKMNPVKRKLIQIAAFGFCNPQVQNFFSGKIYTGKWKNFCAPGLNCYSCPAAIFSCPIGAMQAVGGSFQFSFSFYAMGIILAIGVLIGRTVCAFLCPFGLLQELIHKIPSPKIRLPKFFRSIKYIVLFVFVLIMPAASSHLTGVGDPAFCKYICPAGLFEGGLPLIAARQELRGALGALFFLKLGILIGTLASCVFIHRFFCKTLCPLGALYGILNKVSFRHLKINRATCTQCGACKNVCPMDVNPVATARSAECILCGKCEEICPQGSIRISWRNDRTKEK